MGGAGGALRGSPHGAALREALRDVASQGAAGARALLEAVAARRAEGPLAASGGEGPLWAALEGALGGDGGASRDSSEARKLWSCLVAAPAATGAGGAESEGGCSSAGGAAELALWCAALQHWDLAAQGGGGQAAADAAVALAPGAAALTAWEGASSAPAALLAALSVAAAGGSPLVEGSPAAGAVCAGSAVAAPEGATEGLCTFTSSGRSFTEQPWYVCYTCGLDGGQGCCSVCAERCHAAAGHRVVFSRVSRFFCDCGAAASASSSAAIGPGRSPTRCCSLRPRRSRSPPPSSVPLADRAAAAAVSAAKGGAGGAVGLEDPESHRLCAVAVALGSAPGEVAAAAALEAAGGLGRLEDSCRSALLKAKYAEEAAVALAQCRGEAGCLSRAAERPLLQHLPGKDKNPGADCSAVSVSGLGLVAIAQGEEVTVFGARGEENAARGRGTTGAILQQLRAGLGGPVEALAFCPQKPGCLAVAGSAQAMFAASNSEAAVAAAAAAGSHPRVEVVTFDPSGGVCDRLPLRMDLRPALVRSRGAVLPDARAAPEGRPVAISWADSSSTAPLHTAAEAGGSSSAPGASSSARKGVWDLGLVVATRCRIAAFELAPGPGSAGRTWPPGPAAEAGFDSTLSDRDFPEISSACAISLPWNGLSVIVSTSSGELLAAIMVPGSRSTLEPLSQAAGSEAETASIERVLRKEGGAVGTPGWCSGSGLIAVPCHSGAVAVFAIAYSVASGLQQMGSAASIRLGPPGFQARSVAPVGGIFIAGGKSESKRKGGKLSAGVYSPPAVAFRLSGGTTAPAGCQSATLRAEWQVLDEICGTDGNAALVSKASGPALVASSKQLPLLTVQGAASPERPPLACVIHGNRILQFAPSPMLGESEPTDSEAEKEWTPPVLFFEDFKDISEAYSLEPAVDPVAEAASDLTAERVTGSPVATAREQARRKERRKREREREGARLRARLKAASAAARDPLAAPPAPLIEAPAANKPWQLDLTTPPGAAIAGIRILCPVTSGPQWVEIGNEKAWASVGGSSTRRRIPVCALDAALDARPSRLSVTDSLDIDSILQSSGDLASSLGIEDGPMRWYDVPLGVGEQACALLLGIGDVGARLPLALGPCSNPRRRCKVAALEVWGLPSAQWRLGPGSGVLPGPSLSEVRKAASPGVAARSARYSGSRRDSTAEKNMFRDLPVLGCLLAFPRHCSLAAAATQDMPQECLPEKNPTGLAMAVAGSALSISEIQSRSGSLSWSSEARWRVSKGAAALLWLASGPAESSARTCSHLLEKFGITGTASPWLTGSNGEAVTGFGADLGEFLGRCAASIAIGAPAMIEAEASRGSSGVNELASVLAKASTRAAALATSMGSAFAQTAADSLAEACAGDSTAAEVFSEACVAILENDRLGPKAASMWASAFHARTNRCLGAGESTDKVEWGQLAALRNMATVTAGLAARIPSFEELISPWVLACSVLGRGLAEEVDQEGSSIELSSSDLFSFVTNAADSLASIAERLSIGVEKQNSVSEAARDLAWGLARKLAIDPGPDVAATLAHHRRPWCPHACLRAAMAAASSPSLGWGAPLHESDSALPACIFSTLHLMSVTSKDTADISMDEEADANAAVAFLTQVLDAIGVNEPSQSALVMSAASSYSRVDNIEEGAPLALATVAAAAREAGVVAEELSNAGSDMGAWESASGAVESLLRVASRSPEAWAAVMGAASSSTTMRAMSMFAAKSAARLVANSSALYTVAPSSDSPRSPVFSTPSQMMSPSRGAGAFAMCWRALASGSGEAAGGSGWAGALAALAAAAVSRGHLCLAESCLHLLALPDDSSHAMKKYSLLGEGALTFAAVPGTIKWLTGEAGPSNLLRAVELRCLRCPSGGPQGAAVRRAAAAALKTAWCEASELASQSELDGKMSDSFRAATAAQAALADTVFSPLPGCQASVSGGGGPFAAAEAFALACWALEGGAPTDSLLHVLFGTEGGDEEGSGSGVLRSLGLSLVASLDALSSHPDAPLYAALAPAAPLCPLPLCSSTGEDPCEEGAGRLGYILRPPCGGCLTGGSLEVDDFSTHAAPNLEIEEDVSGSLLGTASIRSPSRDPSSPIAEVRFGSESIQVRFDSPQEVARVRLVIRGPGPRRVISTAALSVGSSVPSNTDAEGPEWRPVTATSVEVSSTSAEFTLQQPVRAVQFLRVDLTAIHSSCEARVSHGGLSCPRCARAVGGPAAAALALGLLDSRPNPGPGWAGWNAAGPSRTFVSSSVPTTPIMSPARVSFGSPSPRRAMRERRESMPGEDSSQVQTSLGPGAVCGQCGEHALQCRRCRNIDYDRPGAFLCNECGASRFAQGVSLEMDIRKSPGAVQSSAMRTQARQVASSASSRLTELREGPLKSLLLSGGKGLSAEVSWRGAPAAAAAEFYQNEVAAVYADCSRAAAVLSNMAPASPSPQASPARGSAPEHSCYNCQIAFSSLTLGLLAACPATLAVADQTLRVRATAELTAAGSKKSSLAASLLSVGLHLPGARGVAADARTLLAELCSAPGQGGRDTRFALLSVLRARTQLSLSLPGAGSGLSLLGGGAAELLASEAGVLASSLRLAASRASGEDHEESIYQSLNDFRNDTSADARNESQEAAAMAWGELFEGTLGLLEAVASNPDACRSPAVAASLLEPLTSAVTAAATGASLLPRALPSGLHANMSRPEESGTATSTVRLGKASVTFKDYRNEAFRPEQENAKSKDPLSLKSEAHAAEKGWRGRWVLELLLGGGGAGMRRAAAALLVTLCRCELSANTQDLPKVLDFKNNEYLRSAGHAASDGDIFVSHDKEGVQKRSLALLRHLAGELERATSLPGAQATEYFSLALALLSQSSTDGQGICDALLESGFLGNISREILRLSLQESVSACGSGPGAGARAADPTTGLPILGAVCLFASAMSSEQLRSRFLQSCLPRGEYNAMTSKCIPGFVTEGCGQQVPLLQVILSALQALRSGGQLPSAGEEAASRLSDSLEAVLEQEGSDVGPKLRARACCALMSDIVGNLERLTLVSGHDSFFLQRVECMSEAQASDLDLLAWEGSRESSGAWRDGAAWEDETLLWGVAAASLQSLSTVVCPEKQARGCQVVLKKAPTQEEFIRGTLGRTPYSSEEVGPLMRDVKNFICRTLGLDGLLDDDFGMELLVARKIVSLDLKVVDVFEQIWLSGATHGGLDPAMPMVVVYRLQGLDGEATEPMVKNLKLQEESGTDPEMEFLHARTLLENDARGLRSLLRLLKLPMKSFSSGSRGEVGTNMLRLLLAASQLRDCRQALATLGASHVFVRRAREAFTERIGKSEGSADDLLLGAQGPPEALLLLLEATVNESLAMHAEEDAEGLTVGGVPTSPARIAPEELCAQVGAFLTWLEGIEQAEADAEDTGESKRSVALTLRVLPFLTRGNARAASLVVDHFSPALRPLNGDAGSNRVPDLGRERLAKLAAMLQALRPGDSTGATLCAHFIEQRAANALASAVLASFPAPVESGAFGCPSWDKNSSDFLAALEDTVPALALGALGALVQRSSPLQASQAVQELIGLEEEIASEADFMQVGMEEEVSAPTDQRGELLLRLMLTLEGSSSSSGVGACAESLLAACETASPEAAVAIDRVRRAEELYRKEKAEQRRKDVLGQLGMTTVAIPGAGGAAKIVAASPGSFEAELACLDLDEELGPACCVCQEGYSAQPHNLLGLYCLLSRSGGAGPLRGGQPRCVSHATAIHFACHRTARRADAARRRAVREWEGAALRNSGTKCNVLLPIPPPTLSSGVMSATGVPKMEVEKADTDFWARLPVTAGGSPSDLPEDRFLSAVALSGDLLGALVTAVVAGSAQILADESGGGGIASNAIALPWLLALAGRELQRAGPQMESATSAYAAEVLHSEHSTSPPQRSHVPWQWPARNSPAALALALVAPPRPEGWGGEALFRAMQAAVRHSRARGGGARDSRKILEEAAVFVCILDCFRRTLPAGTAHTLSPEDLQDLGESLGAVLSAASASLQKESGAASGGLAALGVAKRPLLEAAGLAPEGGVWDDSGAVEAALGNLREALDVGRTDVLP